MIKTNYLLKTGIIMLFIGLAVKIPALILDVPNAMFAGLGFTGIGIVLLGMSIFKDAKFLKYLRNIK